MAGMRKEEGKDTVSSHTHTVSFVVSGDAGDIWSMWQRDIRQDQIDEDLSRGGALQGPIFQGARTGGHQILSFEESGQLPLGTALALTQSGLSSFDAKGFIVQILGVGFANQSTPHATLEWRDLTDSFELVLKQDLPPRLCSTEGLTLSAFTEVIVPFSRALTPKGDLKAKVFIRMESSDEALVIGNSGLFSKVEKYGFLTQLFPGISFSIANFALNGNLLTDGLRPSRSQTPLSGAGEGARIDTPEEKYKERLSPHSSPRPRLAQTQKLEVVVDFSVLADPVIKNWKSDLAFSRQGEIDAARVGDEGMGNTYSDFDVCEALRGFMHQGAIHTLIAFDSFLNNMRAEGECLLELFVSPQSILESGRSGIRDFHAEQIGQTYQISTQTLRRPPGKAVSILGGKDLESPIGTLEFAEGHMEIPVADPATGETPGQIHWGVHFQINFDAKTEAFEINRIATFFCQHLAKAYFYRFKSFLLRVNESASASKIDFRVNRVVLTDPEDRPVLIPESTGPVRPAETSSGLTTFGEESNGETKGGETQPLLSGVLPTGGAPPQRHRWGRQVDAQSPAALPVDVDSALKGENSCPLPNNPLVPVLPYAKKNLKVSFAKGVALAASFLLLFVVVAAVTHGVGVVPMLWGGLTLMSSLTGGSVGGASALAFLGLGGALKVAKDKKQTARTARVMPQSTQASLPSSQEAGLGGSLDLGN
jgi:hypothetical protein